MTEDDPSAEMCPAIHTKFVVFGGKYTYDNSHPLVFQTRMVWIPRYSGTDQKISCYFPSDLLTDLDHAGGAWENQSTKILWLLPTLQFHLSGSNSQVIWTTLPSFIGQTKQGPLYLKINFLPEH